MMRVVIQVESGLKAGHRFSLRPGEQLQFGRTEWADAVFESDREMSSVHFRIQAEQNACYVEDLDSKHGTIVNNQPVKRVMLRSGDRIKAGQTAFLVDLEGAVPNAVEEPVGSPVVPATTAGGVATYCAERCKSTLYCYRGSVVEMPPARLAKSLHDSYQTTIILNPARLPPPQAPEMLTDAEYLFNWLPEEIRQLNSPVCLFQDQQLGNLSVVHHAWCLDALVVVYSEKDEPVPLEQLRRCAGVFVRPSLMRPQLSETAAEQAHDFLLGIEAVLVEAESPESWLVYSTSDLEPCLQKLGLRRVKPETPCPPCPSEKESQ